MQRKIEYFQTEAGEMSGEFVTTSLSALSLAGSDGGNEGADK